jgi:serine/threonine protein kinase
MSGLEFVEIGSTLGGRYRLEARLGDSDGRAVYEAIDESKVRSCALELLAASALAVDRRPSLMQQIELVRDIDHPQLVLPFHAGTNNALDLFFVASSLVDGVNLASISRQSGPVPPEQVTTWMLSAATALNAFHDAGHAHRQLSMSSLLLARDEAGKPLIMIVDLEKADIVERSSAKAFMAPEGLLHPASAGPPADIYALGQIARFLLGADQEKVKLPRAFDRWLAIATAEKPSGRFDSANEAADALALALGVRSGDDGALRKVVSYDKPPELDETLRPEELEDAAAEAKANAKTKVAAGKTTIDPLGDTQAGAAEIAAAAEDAIALARAKTDPTPKLQIADTVDMVDGERDELLQEALSVPLKPKPRIWIIIAVVIAIIAVVLITLTRR